MNIAAMRQQMATKEANRVSNSLRTAQKKITVHINKVKKTHQATGIKARRDMRENKRLWNEL